MGEVYRARDAKLKRDVAIKVLPDDVAVPAAERMTSVRVTLISDFLDELRLKVPTTR